MAKKLTDAQKAKNAERRKALKAKAQAKAAQAKEAAKIKAVRAAAAQALKTERAVRAAAEKAAKADKVAQAAQAAWGKASGKRREAADTRLERALMAAAQAKEAAAQAAAADKEALKKARLASAALKRFLEPPKRDALSKPLPQNKGGERMRKHLLDRVKKGEMPREQAAAGLEKWLISQKNQNWNVKPKRRPAKMASASKPPAKKKGTPPKFFQGLQILQGGTQSPNVMAGIFSAPKVQALQVQAAAARHPGVLAGAPAKIWVENQNKESVQIDSALLRGPGLAAAVVAAAKEKGWAQVRVLVEVKEPTKDDKK